MKNYLNLFYCVGKNHYLRYKSHFFSITILFHIFTQNLMFDLDFMYKRFKNQNLKKVKLCYKETFNANKNIFRKLLMH